MEPLVFHREAPPEPALSPAMPFPVVVKASPVSISALFEEEESALLRYALGLVGARSVAEDLVQDTFLRLHPLWEQVENPRGWVYRTLRNLALNHLRDHRRETPLDEATSAPDGDLPVAQMGRAEAVGTVQSLLADLPEEDRALIHLKYREGLKYDEIGRRTGLSAGNVGYRLHHILKSLGESLRRAGIEGSEG